MKLILSCQIFFLAFIISVKCATESFRFMPGLTPRMRVGRADMGWSTEQGQPRLGPIYRIGKRPRETSNANEESNDFVPKRGTNGHLGLLPFMRTGRNPQTNDYQTENVADINDNLINYFMRKEMLQSDENSSELFNQATKDAV